MRRSDNDNSVLLSLRVLYTAAILATFFKLGVRHASLKPLVCVTRTLDFTKFIDDCRWKLLWNAGGNYSNTFIWVGAGSQAYWLVVVHLVGASKRRVELIDAARVHFRTGGAPG